MLDLLSYHNSIVKENIREAQIIDDNIKWTRILFFLTMISWSVSNHGQTSMKTSTFLRDTCSHQAIFWTIARACCVNPAFFDLAFTQTVLHKLERPLLVQNSGKSMCSTPPPRPHLASGRGSKIIAVCFPSLLLQSYARSLLGEFGQQLELI